MKTDHDRLVSENTRLGVQVEKSKDALGTKQSEEAELRSELGALTARLDQLDGELRQLATDNDQLQVKLGAHGTESDIVKLEEALETEKHLLQKNEADLDQMNKSKEKALTKQTDLSAKIAKLKEDIVSEEKLVAEARLALDHKRSVYNNQQQRKESFVLVKGKLAFQLKFEINYDPKGSIDAKQQELNSIKLKVDVKRKELSRMKENNERELAEISISSNAQVTAANEKETELVAQIAKFLNVSVESIADEEQGTVTTKPISM